MKHSRGWLLLTAMTGSLLPACLDPFPEDPGNSSRPSFDGSPLPGGSIPAASVAPTSTTSAATSTNAGPGTSSASGGMSTGGDGVVAVAPAGSGEVVAPVPVTPVNPMPSLPETPREADAGLDVDITGDDEPSDESFDAGDAGADADAGPFGTEGNAGEN